MKTIAALVGILSGLGMSYAQMSRPSRSTAVRAQMDTVFAQNFVPNLPGLPPNPVIKPDNPELITVEFEGRTYQVSRYAHDIPFVMIGGRTLSQNGNQSAGNK